MSIWQTLNLCTQTARITRSSTCCRQPNSESNAIHLDKYPRLSELQKVPSMNGCCVWPSEESNAYTTTRVLEGHAASVKQKNKLKRDLGRNPAGCGFLRGSWTAKIVACHIKNKFKVPYGASGALQLAKRMGFSVRYARPVPYNSATPEEQAEYVTKTIKMLKKYSRKRYKAVWVDAAAFVDAPSSTRGLRAIGGKDTVQINFSKKSTQIIGALGQGTLDIQFYQKIDADSVIAFLEYLRCMYGRVLVILDNAGAHTSKQVKDYIESTKGDVVLWFLPPRTPQHNPIEIQWREIRRAVAGIFFGGLDKLQKRIRQLLHSGEVPIVKLFGYMQEALKNQNGPWHPPRIIPVDPAIIQQ